MTASIKREAEGDLEHAFDYYESRREGLGSEMLDEYRRAVERIIRHPNAWHPLDDTYRRCQLNRFPYGVIYRVDASAEQVVIVAIMHMSQNPGWWRSRER